jgi:hypothetical protein
MRRRRLLPTLFAFCWIFTPTVSTAALVTNAPRPITQQLMVNPIVVRDDAGNNPATFLGSAESEIKGFVDTIWAQAGLGRLARTQR